MQVSQWRTIVLLGVLGVGAGAGWASAQVNQWKHLSQPVVVAGENLGFRFEWMNGKMPTGKIVVRLNGQWIEAELGEPRHLQLVPPVPEPPPRPQK